MTWRPVSVLLVALWITPLSGQQLTYDAALANLSDRDPGVRLRTVRMLAASGYVEAAAPLAALISDSSNDVQLAAIDAELSFFVLGAAFNRQSEVVFIEVGGERSAAQAFEHGPLGLRPLAVPAEVTAQLAVAATDDDAEVRWEARFALGTLGSSPLGPDVADQIVRMLDDRDPEMRVAAALVAGRLGVSSGGEGLVYLLNDPSDRVQLAAMEALGDLREARAAVALSQRVEYYQRGPSAEAALRAAARIGHSSSLPLFESFAGARDASLRRFAFEGVGRAGGEDVVAWLQQVAADEQDEAAHLATQFALQRLQRPGLAAVVAGLGNTRLARQARDYLIEFGAASVRTLEGHLQDGDARVRAGVADVLGLLGDAETIDRLDAARADPDADVAEIAARALARVQLRLSLVRDANRPPA